MVVSPPVSVSRESSSSTSLSSEESEMCRVVKILACPPLGLSELDLWLMIVFDVRVMRYCDSSERMEN